MCVPSVQRNVCMCMHVYFHSTSLLVYTDSMFSTLSHNDQCRKVHKMLETLLLYASSFRWEGYQITDHDLYQKLALERTLGFVKALFQFNLIAWRIPSRIYLQEFVNFSPMKEHCR